MVSKLPLGHFRSSHFLSRASQETKHETAMMEKERCYTRIHKQEPIVIDWKSLELTTIILTHEIN